MVEFETVQSAEVTFGDDEFIEIAVKRAVSGEGTDQFISLSRGYIDEEGGKRYKSNFSIPREAEVVASIMDALPEMMGDDG